MTVFSKFLGVFTIALILGWAAGSQAVVVQPVKGFTLTEIGTHLYDASPDPATKTEAQLIVDKLFDMGVRQINLSPRATMTDPRQSFVVPMVSPENAADERARYLRLIAYAKSKGMTVGIRPIFFVIDANGNIPYIEILPGGGEKVWWHGNIQPADPVAWFASFTTYLERYMEIANAGQIEEFTIGAELQSLTVGIGATEWAAFPYGLPGEWLKLLGRARQVLPATTRVMYDINYTDDELNTGGVTEFGGELVVWRQRLVDNASPADPGLLQNWQNLVDFWKGLDTIGVDMYRSLAVETDVIPAEYPALVALLKSHSEEFARQIDDILAKISVVVAMKKEVLLKELGFRSVEKGFIEPFNYAGPGVLNVSHQAAAFEAVLSTFNQPRYDWFKGVVFWDASVDMEKHGPLDTGFSAIGKEQTEGVMRQFFGSF